MYGFFYSMEEQEYISQALRRDWGVVLADTITKEELLLLLAKRLGELIDKSPEEFFQLMYRLDISEQKLHQAMSGVIATEEIANMIYDRQVQKYKSRQYHRNAKNSKDKDLDW